LTNSLLLDEDAMCIEVYTSIKSQTL